jgi:polyisoprenoid-binding protein YceI
MRKTTAILAPALLALTLSAAEAAVSSFEVRSGDAGNLVVFRSAATLESFEGKTRAISGRFDADLESLGDSIRALLEVDLATLDTGIDLRNRHMRENHLHTDKFPKAIFRAGKIVGPIEGSLAPGGQARFSLAGDFTLHGVTRPLVVPITVSRAGADSLIVESSFEVRLPDFEIPRPQFLLLRLNETQKLKIRFVALPASGPAPEATAKEEKRDEK